MERVFKDDDVSRSSLSSGQLDGQAVGLAARVDHHHLQGEVWFGGWMVMVGIFFGNFEGTSESDGWRRGRNFARNSDLKRQLLLAVAAKTSMRSNKIVCEENTLQCHLFDHQHCYRPNGEGVGRTHCKPK